MHAQIRHPYFLTTHTTHPPCTYAQVGHHLLLMHTQTTAHTHITAHTLHTHTQVSDDAGALVVKHTQPEEASSSSLAVLVGF